MLSTAPVSRDTTPSVGQPTGASRDGLSPADYDFDLPPEAIAQTPAARRGDARMMVLAGEQVVDAVARDLLEHLPAEALVVVNDSGVVPARVFGARDDGRRFELLITHPDPTWRAGRTVRAWVRRAKKLSEGQRLHLGGAVEGQPACTLRYLGPDPTDARARRFEIESGDLFAVLSAAGQIPLPPYIHRPDGPTAEDRHRYQTVYASAPGSVAAPTAGLHLEPGLLETLDAHGRLCRLTLHVGPGTFLPMERDDVRAHRVGAERIELGATAAAAISAARAAGRPVVAVGTTVVRTLESVARAQGLSRAHRDAPLRTHAGSTELIITPGHEFLVVDRLLTNFHLPRSSLLMLTATFGGRGRVLDAYARAVARGYRFYSFGDCMLLDRDPTARMP